MKYKLNTKWVAVSLLAGALVWVIFKDFSLGVATFAALLVPAFIALYIPYAKDNPQGFWFKRKLYGWGWTPVTWQGWVVTIFFIGLVMMFALTVDETSPTREVMFTFVMPLLFLTILFFRILYKKGEKPKWQWGRDDTNNDK